MLPTLFRGIRTPPSPTFPIEAPLRAELFGADQLTRHAALLASSHKVISGRGSNRLLTRLDANEKVLRTFQRETKALEASARITPAGEWFLDNSYLIDEQIQMARRHLPRNYSRELPRLANGPFKGLPRVYGIVIDLVSHLDAQIDTESLTSFFQSYQSIVPLKLGELWAVPIMLRLALIENLQRIASLLLSARQDRRRAGHWIDRMQKVSEEDPTRVVTVVAEMAKADIPLSNSFVAEFCQRMIRQNRALQFAQDWVEHKLSAEGRSIEQLVHQESQMQAANQVSVGNSISSLRYLSATDWKTFVEELSVVDHTLRKDPAKIYSRMDFATRDRYRHAIEAFSRYGTLPENDVAEKAITMAESAASISDAGDRKSHVGYYLIDEGKAMMEAAIKPRWPWKNIL
ncbi:MAG: cyclic beta 1-2 glucan synthetase, partial [Candidatus Sumerlaeota bacterium]